MQAENWENLQNVWKGEKKPNVDIEELRAEVKKRESRKRFRIVVETLIVLAVILLTIYHLINKPSPFDYIFLGQLWLITILALTFNFWNRSSLKRADSFSHTQYLKLLFDESLKKRRTAVFVLVLTIVNLVYYTVLFLTGYISLTNTNLIAGATGILIIYTVWSMWYYQIASSNIEYYRKELRKVTDQ